MYRRLLRLFFPAEMVRKHGSEMEEVFLRMLSLERQRHGWRGVAVVWGRAVADGVVNGWLRRGRGPGDTPIGMPSGVWSLLDLKLAARRTWKNPGLTVVGGLAMTTAIAIGTVIFGFLEAATPRSLPLDEGRQVVAVQSWDAAARLRTATEVRDLRRWKETLTQLEDVGAFQTATRNAALPSAIPEPVLVAEMSASGFDLTRVPPHLGRTLQEADEPIGAPPVVVIGQDVWMSRFDGDLEIVGRQLLLDGVAHTIVGVMPRGFAFPLFHDYWVPLRTDPEGRIATAAGNGTVFARLAPGASMESAEAELAAVGLVAPEGDRSSARLLPYAEAFFGEASELFSVRLVAALLGLLLLPPCANLAILTYARTVAREEEFAARHALGASRSRIVAQLVLEVGIIAGLAGVAALVLVRFALVRFGDFMNEQPGSGLPFWFEVNPGPATMLLAAVLVLAATVVAGLFPALRATNRMLESGLRTMSGRAGLSLGRNGTLLIVGQVAFCMAAIPTAVEMTWGTVREQARGPGFPAENFLSARLVIDPVAAANAGDLGPAPAAQFAERWGALQAELVRQIEAEPAVSAAGLGSGVVGDGSWRSIALEPVDGRDPALPPPGVRSAHLVQVLDIATGFLETYQMPVVEGRALDGRDLEGDASAVVVNETFRNQVLGPRSPVGHRFRYLNPSGAGGGAPEWHEIVGVVRDVPDDGFSPRIYHAAAPGDLLPATLSIRLAGSSSGVANRLRGIAAALHPSLRVEAIRSLEEIFRQRAFGNSVGALGLVAGTLSLLLLSAGGIYALMSFTVNRRRREVGIRSALGAPPSKLLGGIFRRALWQLGTGATVGALAALTIQLWVPSNVLEALGGWEVPGVLPATVGVVLMVGLLATLGPALRGLSIEPTEAMRME